MKLGVVVLLVVVAAACSSDPSKPSSATAKTAQANESQEGVICTYEKPTGSFLKEKRCTTAAQREMARQQQGLDDARNSRDSGIE